ncbi:MAG TPA: daunorubicin resistance protein DrrC, partial [Chloroflexi bacterium]|nr:daunorubicin resistance protein DrrC [Chloroflexota bacterium]
MSQARTSDATPAPHPADRHDLIRVHGARVNNLRDVSIEIPKRRLTVFTGVSGSGKSSLVFGTIAAESQRLINETYSAFVQGFMPSQARPEVDVLDGLTTAIIVDQERMGANVRSTVGTATDANAMLRILFSRLGHPHIGSPQAFSFNVASAHGSGAITVERANSKAEARTFTIIGGMCPRCEGMGTVSDIDLTQLFDDSKSIAAGAITIPGYKVDSWWTVGIITASGFLDPNKPIREFTKTEMHDFLYKEPVKVSVNGVNLTYEGLVPKVQKSFLSKDPESLQPHIRAFVDRAATFTACPDCGGSRLSEAARSSKIAGISIADACAMQISDLADWVRRLDEPSVAPLLAKLLHTLESFVQIGLGYLSLDRSAGSLSGGEAQRIRLATQVGSGLVGVCYVLDEPTIGLHQRDNDRLVATLRHLTDIGNTVIVVEHDEDTIRAADHVVDVGPGPGRHGGTIVTQGTPAEVAAFPQSLTGMYLRGERRIEVPTKRRPMSEERAITVKGARANNLKGIDVAFPLGGLVCVTGVSGSGKSTLVNEILLKAAQRAVSGSKAIPAAHDRVNGLKGIDRVVEVDQSPIGRTPRSNPATYTGVFDDIRKLYAAVPESKARGYEPGRFSFNVKGGRCEACQGQGVKKIEMHFLPDVFVACETCKGTRYAKETLDVRFKGRNIAEALDMTVEDAVGFFDAHPRIRDMLACVRDVGLGYMQLGQASTTLSGGEA